MAGIQEYLDLIKNAVYGREVRQAIHDGIETCYMEGKAGATDLVARANIESVNEELTARIDEIVAPSGEAPSAAEVTDARIGADGVTYSNIGTANRTQFTNLKSELNHTNLNIIDASLPYVTVADWEKGGFNSSTGEEVSATNLIRTGFYAISEECEFIFSGVYTSRSTFNYFYDENKLYIGRKNGTTAGVPARAKYVRFCYGFVSSSGQTVDGYGMSNLIAEWAMSIKTPLQQSAEIAEHTALGTLDASTPIVRPDDWEIGGLDGATGEPSSTRILIRTGFFPISDECSYEFTGVFTPDVTARANYFYDENKNYIGRSSTDIPTGSHFVRFCYGFLSAAGQTVDSYGMANLIADWGVSITSPINKRLYSSDIAVNCVLDADLLTGFALNTSGETYSNSNYTTVDYIDVSDTTMLYLNNGARYAFYDSEKVMVSTGNIYFDFAVVKDVKVLEVPSNAAFFRICMLNHDTPSAYIYKSTKEAMAIYKTFMSKDTPSEIFNIDLSTEENYGDINEYDATKITANGYACPTGWDNRVRINKYIVSDYVAYRAHINLGSDGEGRCVLGTIDAGYTNSKHATIVVFDFTNGVVEFRTGASGAGSNINGTEIPAYIYSSFPLTNLSGTEYRIEIGRENRCVYAKVYNLTTGKLCGEDILEEYETSSSYVAKAGALYDYPTFGVIDGSITFRRVSASVPTDVFVAFVGDSITEGSQLAVEDVWANKAIAYLGKGVNLGRGGGNIDHALACARDILPAMKPKYVVITIGTNGGNTPSKLDTLLSLVKAVGAVPILNCIPMKSTSVTDVNDAILAKNTDHTRFDVATAINNNPSQGQNTALFFSDKTHPNVDGGEVMYEQFIATVGWIKQ